MISVLLKRETPGPRRRKPMVRAHLTATGYELRDATTEPPALDILRGTDRVASYAGGEWTAVWSDNDLSGSNFASKGEDV